MLDLEFSQKGYRSAVSGLNGTSRFRYTYFEAAPEFFVYANKNIAFGAGLYYAYLLETEQRNDVQDWISIHEFEIVKDRDIGGILSFMLDIEPFFLKISYEHGFSNITNLLFTDENGEPLEDFVQYNRNIQIGVGYHFGFSKE